MKRIVPIVLLALGAYAFAAPINVQPPYSSPTTGYVDPTAATANGSRPMVACSSSCSSGLINQNTDALQWAINQAAAYPHPVIIIPPGEYPMWRGGTSHNQAQGVLIQNVTNIVMRGYGATLRATGNTAAAKYVMFQVDTSAKNLRFYGVTFSQRDLTGTPEEHSHVFQLGNGSTLWDNIQFVDTTFRDGIAGDGDSIQINGGNDQAHAGQRLTVAHSWFLNHSRVALSYQHGTADTNVYASRFGPDMGAGRCTLPITYEPTTGGGNYDSNFIGNTFDCSQTMEFVFSGRPALADANFGLVFAGNVVLDGWFTAGNTTQAQWLDGNILHSSGFDTVLGYKVSHLDTWVTNNIVTLDDPLAAATATMSFNPQSGGVSSGLWTTGNTINHWTNDVSGSVCISAKVSNAWIDDNSCTYHGALANKFEGYALVSTTLNNASGWVTENHVIRGLQNDGVTLAGMVDLGINYSTPFAGATLGNAIIRDNDAVGTRRTLFTTVTAAVLTQGYPLISGNKCISGCSIGENEPALLVTESVKDTDSVASGSASPSTRATYLTADASFAVPNGVRDGMIKCLKQTVACAATTVTPANFGDGTSISCTSGTGNSACLLWDDSGGKWWLLDNTGWTVNP